MMGSAKQVQLAVHDLRYRIGQISKQLSRLRKHRWSQDQEREAQLMTERQQLRRQLRVLLKPPGPSTTSHQELFE
jgi:regulator of replication initiation timing